MVASTSSRPVPPAGSPPEPPRERFADRAHRLGIRRILGIGLVAATVVTVFVIGDAGSESTLDPGSGAAESAAAEPAGPPMTVPEFCDAFNELTAAHTAAIEDTGVETVVVLKETATTVAGVADRVDEMPPTAREGLQLIAELFVEIPDDATTDDVLVSKRGPTLIEQARINDFGDFLQAECFSDPFGT